MESNYTYAAIVIAAGLSSRMGKFKPLLEVGGKPALFRLLDTIEAAGIKRTFVVTGHDHKKIDKALAGSKYRLSTIYNTDYKTGMFSSIQAGIRRVAIGDAVLLFPVDVPLVGVDTIAGLTGAWERSMLLRKFAPGSDRNVIANAAKHPPFCLPVYEEKNGHPLLIPREYFQDILTYQGDDGLKGFRAAFDADIIKYQAPDAGCVLDMDTPEDYAAILSHAAI